MKSLPNILTVLRVLLIVPFVAMYYIDWPLARWVGLGLFVVAAVTDYLDGYLARRLKVVSDFGRFLDPIADKLIVTAALLVLVEQNALIDWHVIPVILILCREIFISGLREFLGAKKVTVPVSFLAKIKTTLQLVSITGLLYVHAVNEWLGALDIQIWSTILLWVTAVVTVKTGYDYFRAARKYFK